MNGRREERGSKKKEMGELKSGRLADHKLCETQKRARVIMFDALANLRQNNNGVRRVKPQPSIN